MSTNDESLKMEDETKLAKLAASLESPLVRGLRRRQARALVSKAMEDLFELFRLRLVPDERPEDYRGGLVLRLARRTALAEELRKNMQAEELRKMGHNLMGLVCLALMPREERYRCLETMRTLPRRPGEDEVTFVARAIMLTHMMQTMEEPKGGEL